MEKLNGWATEAGKWILLATFLLTPMVTLRPGESATFGDLFLVLSVCAAGAIILIRRRLPEIPLWILGGGGLLVISIGITVAFPPDSVRTLVTTYFPNPYSSTVSTGARLIAALIVLPLAVGVLADRRSTVSLAAWAWIAGVSLSCLVAVFDGMLDTGLQVALADNPTEIETFLAQEPPRYVGLGVHPTSFAVTASMVMPVLLAKMSASKRFLALSPVMLLLVLGIVLSGSRVGYVGAALAVILSLWLNPALRRMVFRPDPRIWVPVLLVLGLSAAIFVKGPISNEPEVVVPAPPPTAPAPIEQSNDGDRSQPSRGQPGGGKGVGKAAQGSVPNQQKPENGQQDTPPITIKLDPTDRFNPSSIASIDSNDKRLEFAKQSVSFFVDRPLTGYGFEWIESAHNIYLQLLVSGGILALIGFLWVYGGFVWRGFRMRGQFSGDADAVRVATVVSLISYLVMGLVQPDLLDRYLYLPAGLILALSASREKGGSGESGTAGEDEVSG